MAFFFVALLVLGIGHFLSSVVSFVAIPVSADQTIRTLTFAGPMLLAAAILTLAFCIFHRNRLPVDRSFTTAIVALSFWCLHLGLANFIIYCSVFLINGYFYLSGPTMFFIFNAIITSLVLIVALVSVNKNSLAPTEDDNSSRRGRNNDSGQGTWVRYSWADEYGCFDIKYKTLAVGQLFSGIVLTIIGLVGLFNVKTIFPLVAIAAGSMIFTSGIMGEFTSKLNSPNTGNWFVAFSRIAMMACWLTVICDIVFMARGAGSSLLNHSLLYVLLFAVLAAGIVGFFFAVYVEVLVGSRLGLHKFDSARNGEEWMGYENAIKTRECCFAVIQFICAMMCFIAAVLATAILNGDPLVVFVGLTGCLLMASGRTAANILRRKNIMTYTTYVILCVLTSCYIVANLIIAGYQLFIKISTHDISSTFSTYLCASLLGVIASLIALPTTLYSVYYYSNIATSLVINDLARNDLGESTESKALLYREI